LRLVRPGACPLYPRTERRRAAWNINSPLSFFGQPVRKVSSLGWLGPALFPLLYGTQRASGRLLSKQYGVVPMKKIALALALGLASFSLVVGLATIQL
jgi:hypothetical protein